ncbi:hydantoinase/oxoprolinase family protein [Komagataeibacter nataicola]|nr:hydantoinase/oxoprolinase family protein [Komagataeibacter nataicola]WNM08872.1 hydantoinase/oxoprolinase family protein [Komagataeibacter nataicola]
MDSLKNRVGIDVGGTFTDFVMFMPGADRLVSHKHPSVPSDPSRAVIQGLAELLEMTDTTPKQIGAIVHGTTIGLNAILQRNGARVALLVSQGFRDVLEVGRGRMPSSLNFHAVKESPLVPRDCVIEINARLDPQGNVLAAPTGAELERVRSEIRALAPDAVAVMVLHGYANAAFEERLVTSLSMHLPGVSFCSASSIWPEIREYERTLVACMNASIQPLMQRYFDRLEAGIASLSIEAPLFISTSNGGLVNLRTARARPVETLLSGPAAGVTAASRIAVAAGADHVVTFDMGGTSSDVAVASGGQPEFTTRTDIGGLPLILPTVAVEAIGAGGGSVVHVDAHGIIKVGPKSAGAFPGPVAYGQGERRQP